MVIPIWSELLARSFHHRLSRNHSTHSQKRGAEQKWTIVPILGQANIGLPRLQHIILPRQRKICQNKRRSNGRPIYCVLRQEVHKASYQELSLLQDEARHGKYGQQRMLFHSVPVQRFYVDIWVRPSREWKIHWIGTNKTQLAWSNHHEILCKR